jgi:DNA polymerase-1
MVNFQNIIVYDREQTHEKFGYYPEQVIDYKGIVGDQSDNIPGIKGIGEKTALDMLGKYGSF